MSDNLKWMNQHMVLLKYRTVGELTTSGGCKLPPRYASSVRDDQFVADLIAKLVDEGAIRPAVDVLAYAIHRRAGVWWGLCCVRDLAEELKQAAQTQARKEAEAQQEREKAAAARSEDAEKKAAAEAAQAKEAEERWKKLKEAATAGLAKIQEIKSKFSDEQKKIYADVMKRVEDECVKSTGMPLQTLIQTTAEKDAGAPPQEAAAKGPPPAPAAPAPEADGDDSAPPPEILKTLKEKALAVVSSWVESPTAEHSVQAETIAAMIESEPEGMLARTAFWSFGNLAVAEPDGSNVPTPPGLAGNGLRAALLMAMLAPGGTRSLTERAERYFAIGVEVACGRNNWTVPENASAKASSPEAFESPDTTYRKWK